LESASACFQFVLAVSFTPMPAWMIFEIQEMEDKQSCSLSEKRREENNQMKTFENQVQTHV
jgi:hypothetical protein